MTTTNKIALPPETMVFEKRAWNQTAAKACSLQLLWSDYRVPVEHPRPDNFSALNRRDAGSALHEAARLSLHLLLSKGKWPDAEKVIQRVILTGGGGEAPGNPLSFMAGKGFPELADRIGELVPLVRLFQDRFEFEADDHLGNEHLVAIDANGESCSFWQVPPGGWHGRVDWAEMTGPDAPIPYRLKVIDYKNRPAIHPRAELRTHEQLSTYLTLLSRLYPQARRVNPLQGIYYLQYGVTNYEELTWEEVDANYERLRARVRAKRALRLVDVAPEPGFGRCQYCEYLGDCPQGQKALDGRLGAIVDLASAQDAAKTLFVLDQLYDATRTGLKRFCEEFGPVAISDDTGWGFVTKTSYEVIRKEVETELLKHGLDPETVMRVDMTALKKLVKDQGNKVLEERMAQLIKVDRTGTDFKPYKPRVQKVVTTPKVRGRVHVATGSKSATETISSSSQKKTGVIITPRAGNKNKKGGK